MSQLVDRIIGKIVRLEVRLLACQARLQADTDPEALHDLQARFAQLVQAHQRQVDAHTRAHPA